MWCLQSCLHASTMTKKSQHITTLIFFSADLVGTQYCSTDSQSRSAKWQHHILAFSSFILIRHQEVLMCPTMCWNINCTIAKGGCAGNFTKKVIIPGPGIILKTLVMCMMVTYFRSSLTCSISHTWLMFWRGQQRAQESSHSHTVSLSVAFYPTPKSREGEMASIKTQEGTWKKKTRQI